MPGKDNWMPGLPRDDSHFNRFQIRGKEFFLFRGFLVKNKGIPQNKRTFLKNICQQLVIIHEPLRQTGKRKHPDEGLFSMIVAAPRERFRPVLQKEYLPPRQWPPQYESFAAKGPPGIGARATVRIFQDYIRQYPRLL
ncbi:MAG: hypothetical protein U5K27_11280 [Desulfotignum sp.]|nr:hypothetical protein [Desulfotignum sp.]